MQSSNEQRTYFKENSEKADRLSTIPKTLTWFANDSFLPTDTLYYNSSPISVFRQVAPDGPRLFRANTTFYITDFLSNTAAETSLPLVSEIGEFSIDCTG